jgi:hypothetical protein
MKSITLVALSLALILAFLFVLLPAPAQAAADWYNADWAYRKQITIDHNNVPSTLTNFPVLINTTDADWRDAANGGHIAQPDGGDILFTASDGTTKLAHEIEKYTPTTGELVAWVQVPSLSAVSDTQIYIYYGNAGCADQWDVSGTWASDYKMVQHLEETSGTHYDSTQYGNDGIPHGGVIQGTAGRIDGADDFDGVDDYIACGNDTSLNIVEEITIEALVKGEGAGFNSTQRTDTYLWKSKPQLQVVGSKIYYVWCDTLGYNHIWTGEMNTDGTDWTATNRTTSVSLGSPQLQVVGDKIYYVWYEYGGSYFQIWTGEMNTDGTNWTAINRTTSAYYKYEPQLQVVGTKIYYVWYEWNGDVDYQIWTGEMNTDGTNWTATQRTDGADILRLEPQLQVVGDKIYYVWDEDDGSYVQIWTGEMNTDGTNWTATKRTTSAYHKYAPQLQVVGDKIYYVWQEHVGTNPEQIWTGEMNTDGTGWSATNRTTSAYDKGNPQLQVVGSKIYYVWAEWDGSDYQVWTGEMNNDGTNWTAAKRTEGAGYNKSGLQFQVVGTKTYYVWEQNNHQYDHQIWTGEMGSNILNKGDFYGIGIMGDTIRGFIDAGVDGFKYKGDAIDYTAGATVNCAIGSNWTHVAMTYDKSALNLYINGDLEDSSAFNRTINTNDFELVMGDDFDGMIDEVHVLDSAKSGDWKKTCADNELDPAIFYSVGSEETAPPPDAVAPVAAITDPPDGAVVQSQNTISGTITEDNSVASAELMIQRSSDSRYWNGSSWQPSQTWVLATVGGSAPSFTFSYDSSAIIGDDQYTVAARATDGAGNTGTSSSITYTIQTTAPVTAVPSVSVWGIIVMAALFAGLLVWMMESRQMAS